MALFGCGDAVAPLPRGATAFTPPPQYALWWKLTEACSGFQGDMSTVKWYVVHDATALGADVDGVYYTSSHRVVLLADSVSSGALVRHEMLHALGAEPGHPSKYFQAWCSGFVDCSSACIKDGGALPPADTTGPVISPTVLGVTAFTDPAVPTQAESSWVALVIVVTNPYPYSVRVGLKEIFNTPASETFGYYASACPSAGFVLPTYDWIPGGSLALGPGEVRHRVFDIPDWRACRTLQPYFNVVLTPAITIKPIPPSNHGTLVKAH